MIVDKACFSFFRRCLFRGIVINNRQKISFSLTMPRQSNRFDITLESILREYLRRKGVLESVERSWYPFKGQHAPFYSPVADIAVGPFATQQRLISRYDDLEQRVPELINDLKSCFRENYNQYGGHFSGTPTYPFTEFEGNENARCFISIEIESKSPTRKHKMGSIVNAAALGRIAIVIGLDEYSVKVLIRILGYLKFLASVNKPTFKANNAFILSKEQILRILEGG